MILSFLGAKGVLDSSAWRLSSLWGYVVLFPQHLRLSLEMILQGFRESPAAVVGLCCVPLLFSPQRRQHLSLAVPRAFLDVHERLQTPLLLNYGPLFSAERL